MGCHWRLQVLRDFVLLCCWLISLVYPLEAYTWKVPSEHPTIFGAVDSASYGDTVLVAPGTYCRERDLEIDGRGWAWIRMRDGVALLSEAGPGMTTLVESGTHIFNITVYAESVSQGEFKGFTITGGSCGLGGTLQSFNSGIVVLSCDMVIENNKVHDMMYGLVVGGDSPALGTPEIRENEIRDCSEGISMDSNSTPQSPLIEDNTIHLCSIGLWGHSCSPYIVGNAITQNEFVGVYFEGYSSSSMEMNTITYNGAIGVQAIMDDPYTGPCLNCAWVPERANDVYGNGDYDVYYQEETGLGLFEATYNYWGTLCPDPARFFGRVSVSIWVDSTHTVICNDCGNCHHSTEPTTWGVIKALFR